MVQADVLVWQERLVVAKERASLDIAQNAALCVVCRTPVRDTPPTADNNVPPPALPAGALRECVSA